jgi:squalene synthase HpnC
MSAANLASGKNADTENFPVASWLIAPRFRQPIIAFYRFARTADDIADHASATPADKLALLDDMRATVMGEADSSPEALGLRLALQAHGLDARHPLDLLAAFRRDAANPRVRDWDDLIAYCRVSAMPVGRFVLDVHGENRATWPASDALCAALQIINHVQDCGEDYRELGRVYVPETMLAAAGTNAAALGEPRSCAALRTVIVEMVARTDLLLARSAGFAASIADRRLALEVAVIHRLAVNLADRLRTRDPLAERVRHSKPEAIGLTILALAGHLIGGRA